MCVCDIGMIEQYKECCPCHFHYRPLCYPYFIFSSELDMSILSTSFKFGRLASIPLTAKSKSDPNATDSKRVKAAPWRCRRRYHCHHCFLLKLQALEEGTRLYRLPIHGSRRSPGYINGWHCRCVLQTVS